MTFEEAYNRGKDILTKADVPDASIDARLLLEEVAGVNKAYLLAHANEELKLSCEDSIEERYFDMIERRAKRIPLQHIVGYQEFMSLRFKVNEDVLVPRFDTENLVEEALKHVHDGMRVLDMCTGSGCILISILNYSNDCTGVGVDISDKALKVAKENAKNILKDRQDINISFLKSDLFSELSSEEKFDVIVSNPPYIQTEVIKTLEREVKDYDPIIALDGGADGLAFYRRIIDSSGDYLNPGGVIIFEIGYDEALEVTNLLKRAGFINISVTKDLSGLDRVVIGYKTCLTN